MNLIWKNTRARPLSAESRRASTSWVITLDKGQLANKTVENFVSRLHRLYEQKKTAPEGAAILGHYVTRWLRWTQAGLSPPISALSVGPQRSIIVCGACRTV
jgi:hypothetical protein